MRGSKHAQGLTRTAKPFGATTNYHAEEGALLNWKRFLAKHSPLLILAALCIVLAISSENFRSAGNLQNIALRTCVVSIIAVGQILVILTGGIDLSVGSLAALGGAVGCLSMKAGVPVLPSILLGSCCGMLCGAINGVLVTKGRIPPFIVTLGMMMSARGVVMLLTGAKPVFGLPAGINFLGGKEGWWIPVIIALVITAVFAIILTYTRFGRGLYAMGGNMSAARLSGINVDGMRLVAYSLCGLLAGFAGMMLASRVGIGDPSAAEGYELDAIAACVMGGASLTGGEGGTFGALAGALIMNVLVNYCNLVGVEVHWQRVLVGTLIVALVYYDNLRKRRANLLQD